jgi:hypothetical protein
MPRSMPRDLPGNVIVLFAALAALSCSSSGSGGNCGKGSACGGNIVGSWQITSACSTGGGSMPNSSCPGETISIDSANESGSIDFAADGTYMATISSTVKETLIVPVSCLSMGGATVTCDQFGMALSGALMQPDGGSTGTISASCSMSGANCNCSTTFAFSGQTATGTYATSGTNVTITPNGGPSTIDGYCVQGNTLNLFSSGSSGMMGTSAPGADIVASKQ